MGNIWLKIALLVILVVGVIILWSVFSSPGPAPATRAARPAEVNDVERGEGSWSRSVKSEERL